MSASWLFFSTIASFLFGFAVATWLMMGRDD